MPSPYDPPSPPSVTQITYATMPTFTPAQDAVVEEKISAALDRLSVRCADPFDPVTVNVHPTPDSNWETSPEISEPKIKKSTTWCTQDVGYFLPKQPLEDYIVLENGNLFYQDVWAFTNYLRVLAETTEEETICANLHFCLRGKALEWYTTELTPTQRAELGTKSLATGWLHVLDTRFGPGHEIAEDQLNYRGYGWSDVENGHSVVVWAQNLLRHAQIDWCMDVGSDWEDDWTIEQLQIIWENLSESLAKDIAYPGEKTTLADFKLEPEEAYKSWRWIVGAASENYEPRVRKPVENGYANGEVVE